MLELAAQNAEFFVEKDRAISTFFTMPPPRARGLAARGVMLATSVRMEKPADITWR